MDPISAIFVMVVLGGLFAKGVDVATDGLLSAEVGAGVRGVGAYGVRAGRARWRLARMKAREIRQRTPQGRAVQEVLDLSGLIARVLFGEARRFGSGVRSGWRTGREQARSARTERRGDEPWPIVRVFRSGAVRVQEWAERRAGSGAGTPNDVPNEPEPNDPNGASSESEPEPNTTTATDPNERRAVKTWEPNSGCLFVLDWHDEDERRRPDFCGKDREEGWVYCPQHMRKARAETYQSDDLEDLRAEYYTDPNGDPNVSANDPCPCGYFHGIGPDGRLLHCGRPVPGAGAGQVSATENPNPNGDPNVPLESSVPNQNGDVKCGCCAQLHKPLPPGEHCPDCHIHDQPTPPNGTAPNAPTTKGTTMADINSAPAAIAAAEAFAPRFESLQSRADALAAEWDTLKNDADTLHGEFATLMDGMGDFAIGGEADTAASVGELSDSTTSAKEQADNVVTSVSTAKEAHGAYVDNLHLEFDNSIEAAAGKAADAHAVMQEA